MGYGVGEAEKKAKELVEKMVRWKLMTLPPLQNGNDNPQADQSNIK